MQAGLTVGDFSRITHLSVKTLRHYHEVGLLEPATVNPSTGYRYYSGEQVPTAQVIRRLRDLEMPVGEVKAVLEAPDALARNILISAHLGRLEAELAQTRAAVDSLRNLLRPPEDAPAIEHRSVPAIRAAGITAVVDRADALPWWQGALGELHATVRGQGLRATGPSGGVFASELFQHDRGEATVFIPVEGGVRTIGRVTYERGTPRRTCGGRRTSTGCRWSPARHRHPRRPGAGHARRLGDHRPHLARWRDQDGQPGGEYLISHGVDRRDFNSYGSRRGNHEVMIRGTFASIRLRNQLAPGTEGGVTVKDGEQLSIYENLPPLPGRGHPADRPRREGVRHRLVPRLGRQGHAPPGRPRGARELERIDRSNLIGMGVLPLQYRPGESAAALGLTGRETFDVRGVVRGRSWRRRECRCRRASPGRACLCLFPR